MRFRTILQWTLGVHFFALSLAYFIQPKKADPLPKPMRSVTVQLKPPPPPKKPAAAPTIKSSVKKTTKKKTATPKKKAAPKKPTRKPTPSPSKPTPIQPIPTDYQHLLIQSLKEQLELPEIGSVELQITFGKNGGIEKIDVLASQSAANSRYLVSAIKKIELPLLPRNLRGNCKPLVIEFSSTGS